MTTPFNPASAVAPATAGMRVYPLTKNKQYVYYAASGGTLRVFNLAPGNYTGGFYNPRAGGALTAVPPFTVSSTPNSRDFTTPDGNDWVLLLRAP